MQKTRETDLCGGGGEELNWKSDEKNSAGSRVLQQPFEGAGYIEWKSASRRAASC